MLNLSADLLENLAKKIRKKAGKNPKKSQQKIQLFATMPVILIAANL